jgi:CheY-like chemotaxis protein
MITGPIRQILLVDDNPQDAQLTHVALSDRARGYTIETVSGGAEALDYLYRRGKFEVYTHELPVLVLLDLKMPGLDGFEVLRVVKQDENLRQIPIIVFTSSQYSVDVEACYRLGANAFVMKPIDFQELSKTMEAVCSFWLRTNLVPKL